MYRPRLFHIETEEELFKYFSKNASYIQENAYQCAGLIAGDTSALYLKLIKEWKKDVKYYEKVEAPEIAKQILEKA